MYVSIIQYIDATYSLCSYTVCMTDVYFILHKYVELYFCQAPFCASEVLLLH